jgi:hypothetical protein
MTVLQPLNIGDITNKIQTNKKCLNISVNAPQYTQQPAQPVLKPEPQVRRKNFLPLIGIIFQFLVINSEISKLKI